MTARLARWLGNWLPCNVSRLRFPHGTTLSVIHERYYIEQTLCKQDFYYKKYQEDKNAQDAPDRIINLMRSYYEENHARIAALNPLRFMYEESPYYEQGYVISEILERYRKMVETVQRPFKYKSDSFFVILKRVELTQKLYFEIYHLARMMHETPRKWKSVPEFRETEQLPMSKNKKGGSATLLSDDEAQGPSAEDLAKINEFKEAIGAAEKKRQLEKKRKRKLNKKIRELILQKAEKYPNMKFNYSEWFKHLERKYNEKWPIDYGWEIEDDW
ncbi:unnamed protein product [Spodoptera exigua]|nr:unnamed protein product [Spodoptera exigua]